MDGGVGGSVGLDFLLTKQASSANWIPISRLVMLALLLPTALSFVGKSHRLSLKKPKFPWLCIPWYLIQTDNIGLGGIAGKVRADGSAGDVADVDEVCEAATPSLSVF